MMLLPNKINFSKIQKYYSILVDYTIVKWHKRLFVQSSEFLGSACNIYKTHISFNIILSLLEQISFLFQIIKTDLN